LKVRSLREGRGVKEGLRSAGETWGLSPLGTSGLTFRRRVLMQFLWGKVEATGWNSSFSALFGGSARKQGKRVFGGKGIIGRGEIRGRTFVGNVTAKEGVVPGWFGAEKRGSIRTGSW